MQEGLRTTADGALLMTGPIEAVIWVREHITTQPSHHEMERIMKDQNFTTTFTVEQTPEEVFAAVNNVRGWWSGEIEGSTDKLNDEFTYRYGDLHYSRQKITELIPGKKIVWLVLDAYLSFTEDKGEWKGTEIAFEVSEEGDRTAVRFTHLGLVPEYECFDTCSNAWGFYINGSLRSLINTGKGYPNQKEKVDGERASL